MFQHVLRLRDGIQRLRSRVQGHSVQLSIMNKQFVQNVFGLICDQQLSQMMILVMESIKNISRFQNMKFQTSRSRIQDPTTTVQLQGKFPGSTSKVQLQGQDLVQLQGPAPGSSSRVQLQGLAPGSNSKVQLRGPVPDLRMGLGSSGTKSPLK